MFKILDYCDEFRELNPTEFVEPMIIANIIPSERKRRLSHRGISYREIPEIEFTGGISPTISDHTPVPMDPQGQVMNESKPTHSVSNTNLSIEKLPIPKLSKLPEYSSSEIGDLNDAISCFYQVVLPRKTIREAEAAEVLKEFRGKYNVEILDKIFDLVDKDPTGPLFGQTFARPNRNRLYGCQMAGLNHMIDKLLETGDLGWLGRWQDAGNRGMKGGATVLMYLYSPDQYNIWLPKTHRGLSMFTRVDADSPQKKMSPQEYTIYYKRFNEAAIAVREEYGFVSQAMDWLLWAVGEIKENPGNRSLRSHIEGRTK